MKFKYFTKSALKDLLDRKTWSRLDDDLKYPVVKHMLHNDDAVRVWIATPGKVLQGRFPFLAMMVPIKMFNELPEHEMEDRRGK